jgi:hypothetical protein
MLSRVTGFLLAVLVAATVSVGETAPLGRIRGEVLVAYNRPLVGAVAVAVSREAPALLVATTTDGWGFFELPGLPDGPYRTIVLRPGYAPMEAGDVEVRGPFPVVLDHTAEATGGRREDPEVRLPGPDGDAAPVRLLVRDPEDAPVDDARVLLRRLDREADPVMKKIGPGGDLELESIPAGTYYLRVGAVGRLPVVLRRLVLPGGAPVELRALLQEQPLSYRPLPGEVLPAEVPLAPPEVLGTLPATPPLP